MNLASSLKLRWSLAAKILFLAMGQAMWCSHNCNVMEILSCFSLLLATFRCVSFFFIVLDSSELTFWWRRLSIWTLAGTSMEIVLEMLLFPQVALWLCLMGWHHPVHGQSEPTWKTLRSPVCVILWLRITQMLKLKSFMSNLKWIFLFVFVATSIYGVVEFLISSNIFTMASVKFSDFDCLF